MAGYPAGESLHSQFRSRESKGRNHDQPLTAADERPQVRCRGPDRLDANGTMAGQFDGHAPRAPDLAECLENRPKVHCSFTKHQMLVIAANHILDMNVEN